MEIGEKCQDSFGLDIKVNILETSKDKHFDL